MRKIVDEVVYPDAQACEESGKCVSPLLLFTRPALNSNGWSYY